MDKHIETLEELVQEWRTEAQNYVRDNYDEHGVGAIALKSCANQLDAAIALMRGQSGWISVKDATPDEDVPVWCLTKGDGIFIGGYVNIDEGWVWTNTYTSIYHTLKDGEWKWEANDFEYDDEYEVIAWKHLPAPPKDTADEQ